MTEQDLCDAMRAHGETVYRLALCRMQNVPDAEDVYQDVFLRLLGQDTVDWDDTHMKAWLIRVTVNRCNDLHRFRLRRPVLPLEELSNIACTTNESGQALWAAVAALPQNQRTVIHLHYGEGYSCEELASVLHLPAATVRSRLQRGRKRLKQLLGGWNDEE